MVYAMLIMIIGIMPILFGYYLFKYYGKTKLILAVFIYLCCICMRQIDVAMLYLVLPNVNNDIVLFIYKIFRAGIIFRLFSLIYITYLLFKEYKQHSNNFLDKLSRFLINKYTVMFSLLIAIIEYIVNFTSYGIKSLNIDTNELLHLQYYYPVYGSLTIPFRMHFIILIIFQLLLLPVIMNIKNKEIKAFMYAYIISALILCIIGLSTFSYDTHYLFSNLAALIHSIIIAFSFIKMYNELNNNYNILIEGRTRIDYVKNLTSSLIHEVKNSLSLIQGYSEILPNMQPLQKQTKEFADYIHSASIELSDVINAYNEFLKNNIQMNFEHKNIVKVINDAIQIMNDKIKEKNVQLFFCTKEKKLQGYINAHYLCQAFVHLIKNAIEAIPPDKKNKEIFIYLTDGENEKITIDIKSSGFEIDREKWDKIFLPYRTSENANLELAFCNQVIFAHRGFIHIKDSNSDGTHVEIRLPKYKFSNITKED